MQFSTVQREDFEREMKSPKLAAALVWINKYLNPDDVFDEEQLENWALKNGYSPPGGEWSWERQ